MAHEGPDGPTDWWRYVEVGLSQRGWNATDFERASGIDRSQINKWRDRRVRPTPEFARKVAAAFGHSPITALVAAGVLRREELEQPVELPLDLASIHTDTLFAELRRRCRDFGNAVTIPTDEEIEQHPERYSVGRLSLDRSGRTRHDTATGDTPTG